MYLTFIDSVLDTPKEFRLMSETRINKELKAHGLDSSDYWEDTTVKNKFDAKDFYLWLGY